MLAAAVSLSLHVHTPIIYFSGGILYLSWTWMDNKSIKYCFYNDRVRCGCDFKDALALDLVIHKLSLKDSAIFEYHDAWTVSHVSVEVTLVNIAIRVHHPSYSIFHSILESTFKFRSCDPRMDFIVYIVNEISKTLNSR